MAKKNGRHLADYKGDLYHRHFCPKGHRVFPYDSMEALTVAPKPGAKGNPILLYSYNSSLREKNPELVSRVGYCWVCREWVETTRKTKMDVQLDYMRRQGVQFRFPSGKIEAAPAERTFVRALNTRLEERRIGGGTISVHR